MCNGVIEAKRGAVITRLALLSLMLLVASQAIGQEANRLTSDSQQDSDSSKKIGDDLLASPALHVFDFDELGDGNLEDVPKFWGQIKLVGFPRFAKGGFDYDVGHTAPPAFYLSSEGRSVGFQYSGPDTIVRIGTEYRLEAALKPAKLSQARACICAFYQNPLGQPIVNTMVRSSYLTSTTVGDGWQAVDLFLPPAPPQARSIGLAVWVLAEPIWNHAPKPRRHIPKRDVLGGLWVDDIAIYPLPRVELSIGSAGHIVPDGEQGELSVLLWDTEQKGIDGKLTVTDADGQTVLSRNIDSGIGVVARPIQVAISHLPPGAYQAELTAYIADKPIVTRSLHFLRLGPRYREIGANAISFGVVLDPRQRLDAEEEIALLRHIAIRSVKWPAWTGLGSEAQSSERQKQDDRVLQELARHGYMVTAVLAGPPTPIVDSSGPYARSLLDVIAEQPSYWKAYLDAVVAPYASIVRLWQIGDDRQPWETFGDRFDKGVSQLTVELRRFITNPAITAPISSSMDFSSQASTLQQATVVVSSHMGPATLAAEFERVSKLGYRRLTAYIEPLPLGSYHRKARLADLATRLIEARHAGVQTVFVPQPWTVSITAQGAIADPMEDYIIVRTLADVLADATPGPVIKIDESVRALAFYHGGRSKLAIWDAGAQWEGRTIHLQLGDAKRLVTMFGESVPLQRDDHGRQLVPISPMPVLIDNVSREVMEFFAGIRIAPTHVESGSELAKHTLELPNTSDNMLAGNLVLDLPDGWTPTPRSIDFSIMPGETKTVNVEIKYPHNESAGTKQIRALVSLADGKYLEVPLSLKIGLKDLDVSGMAVVEGTDLVITHTIVNRSDKVAHFRSAAIVPGRQRHYRPIVNLRPRESQVAQYRFHDASNLIGRTVRVELREMNDGPRTHSLELLVP